MKSKTFWKDFFFSLGIFALSLLLNVFLVERFDARTLTPMIFVLGVFLVSWRTQGYAWGVGVSLVSVLAVNYIFTYPYFAFDLITPECVVSAVVMLVVATLTGMLTTRIKHHEKIKAEIERERLRGNLLRAISHDLRTPLTSIYGASSAVVENYWVLEPEHQIELLKGVQEDAQWLIRMVENLLSVTRIDGQGVRIAKVPTVLEELIDTVLLKFRKYCPTQQVTVSIPEEFVTIPMDAMLIEQVLINLLENAVHHAVGMKELKLEVVCVSGKAVFSVSDDGCGITSERLDRLFVGYMERRDRPADGSRRSMGIGLSVCAAIVRAHGGEITAKNLAQGGAAISFALEMEENDE